MSERFFVVGGVHADISFKKLAGEPERYGPFPTYADAFDCWKAKVWLNVDNALHRLVIDRRSAA